MMFPCFQYEVSIGNVSHIMTVTFRSATFCLKEFLIGKNVRMLPHPHFLTFLLFSSYYFKIRKSNNKVLRWIQIIIRERNTKEFLNFSEVGNQGESVYISKLVEKNVTFIEALNVASLTS